MVNMVFHQQSSSSGENDEFFETEEAYAQGEALVRAGGWITKDADMCIQDQGASSFLAGSEYILRYLKWLEIKGYPMDDIVFKRCDKSFRFGGDAEGHSRWMVELPVFISNTPGRMQCFVIFGATPMLLGRPVLEQLGAVVDFGTGKMRILGGQWTNIKRGKQDAMLLKLADNVQNISDFRDPRFDLRAKDDDHSKSEHLRDFLTDLRAESRYDEMQSEVQFAEDPDDEVFYEVESYIKVQDDASDEIFSKDEMVERDQCAMTKTWVWMRGQLTATNRRTAALANEARDPAQPRKKLIWEVYSGTGLLGETAELMGAEVMRFGLHNGWDFTKSSHRRQLLQMADELEPDEIYMSPKCTLWSQMQAINIHNDADWQDLQERRHYDHEVHLKFCRKLYLRQVRRGAHAHVEHPKGSLAWETPALNNLPGERTAFDQCSYGTSLKIDNEDWLVKKPTSIHTTKRAMCKIMSRLCTGDHQHAKLEGGNRCKKTENYQAELSWHIARALMHDEGLSEQAYAVQQDQEVQELTGILRKLGTQHSHEAIRLAYKLHRNLGHPRQETLVKMLQAKKCSPKVIAAVEAMECPYCNKFAVKKQSAPAHAERPTEFNEQLQVDTMWIDLSSIDGAPNTTSTTSKGRKIAVLVMIDTATRYMAARTIPDETSGSLRKALEREWIRIFGPPKQLSVDEWSGWGSDEMAQWGGEHAIEMRISPGQAHTRTSVVERRHQLLRKSLSIFMAENKLYTLDGLHQALSWTVPCLNQSTFVNGYTPMIDFVEDWS